MSWDASDTIISQAKFSPVFETDVKTNNTRFLRCCLLFRKTEGAERQLEEKGNWMGKLISKLDYDV